MSAEVLDSRHANQSAAEVPVDIVTYDDSAADHVAPVSAESAQAAFQQAGQNSMERQEDVVHPGMHIAQTGELLLKFLLPATSVQITLYKAQLPYACMEAVSTRQICCW